MKLGSMFPSPSSKPRTGKKPVVVAASTAQINVTMPKAPKQGAKDYRVLHTEEELVSYLQRCQETGFCSFDYECAPDEDEHLRWKSTLNNHKLVQIQAESTGNDKVVKQNEKALEAARESYLKSPLDPWKSDVCTVSFSAAPNEARVVFISHKSSDNMSIDADKWYRIRNEDPVLGRAVPKKEDLVRYAVFELFDTYILSNSDVMKIAVNMEFETGFTLKQSRYIMNPVADPLMMWSRALQVCDPRNTNLKWPPAGKGLKPMTQRTFGVQMQDFKALLNKHSVNFFDEIDTGHRDALMYSAEDADYGLQHYLYWLQVVQQIPDYEFWLHNIEMPYTRVLGQMKYWGVGWNSDLAEQKREEAENEVEALLNALQGFAKEHFGIKISVGVSGSTADVKNLLYGRLQAPVPSVTEKGSPSKDKEALIDILFMLREKLVYLDEEKYLTADNKRLMSPLLMQKVLGALNHKYTGSDLTVPVNWVQNGRFWNTVTPDEIISRVNSITRIIRPDFLDLSPSAVKSLAHAIDITLRPPHPQKALIIKLVKMLQTLGKYSTLLSGQIKAREKFVHPVTGRVHGSYHPWTQTSRLGCKNPNQMNTPRPHNDAFGVRNLHRAPEGYVWMLADQSGFEMRILADKTGDANLQRVFHDGEDVHMLTAVEIFEKPAEMITKDERNGAKPANFGVSYGIEAHGLRSDHKVNWDQRKTLDECQREIDAVKRAYPDLITYKEKITAYCREKGYVKTIYGFIRLLPDINDSDYRGRSAQRQAMNTPIQGAAADVMKKNQNDVYDEIARGTRQKRTGADTNPIFCHGETDQNLQVHDELGLIVIDDPERVKAVAARVKEIMEKPPVDGFLVPLVAEVDIAADGWGDKVPLEKWLQTKGCV